MVSGSPRALDATSGLDLALGFQSTANVAHLTLRVQKTQIWSMLGFYARNPNSGFGYIPSIWVLGTLRVRS